MITKTIDQIALKFSYKRGKDGNGRDIIKYQRFNNINLTATDEKLYNLGDALSAIVKYPVVAIEREEDSILSKTE